MADRKQWVRLKRGDDWGALYYALEPLNNRGFAEFARGIKVRAGEGVTVRWPDGTAEKTAIALEPYSTEVHDMGHSYHVSGHRIGVNLSARGVARFVDIAEVDVEKAWVEAHTPKGGRRG